MIVNRRLIHSVLKLAAREVGSSEPDAVLRRRFADSRDEAAFAEIVRR